MSERVFEQAHWKPAYGAYNRDTMHRKVDDLLGLSREKGLEVQHDADLSHEFISRSFDRWDGSSDESLEGDFCFVVPPRISRGSDVYAAEVEPLLPILRHFPVDIRQRAFVGLPPFLVDAYGHHGRGGLMVYTPVMLDMVEDLGLESALQVAKSCVADSIGFARRFTGAKVAGLAATLPNLTDMGRSVATDGIVTTTGHAGTVWLISEIARQHLNSDLPARDVGVIGLGSIGYAFAWVALHLDLCPTVNVYDHRDHVSESAVATLQDRFGPGRVRRHAGVGSLVEASGVIVAAVTSPIDLSGIPRTVLEGRFLIDDSQPAAFNADQAAVNGAQLRWVMGIDGTEDAAITRRGIDGRPPYNYGDGCGLPEANTIWGCEGEAAAVALGDRLDLALARRVEPDDAIKLGGLWEELGIHAVPHLEA